MSKTSFLCQIFNMALYNPLLIKKLDEHLKKDPCSKSFCSLAQIYFSSGELEKAEKLCLEGLVHHPFYSPAYVVLSGIYRRQGRIEQAIQLLTKAKELNPDNPQIYKSLGEIYKKQNDIEKTLNAYKMVMFLKPGDKTAVETVRHLEKVIDHPLTEPDLAKDSKKDAQPSSKSFSKKESQKLAKLNQILARVEIHINQQSKSI